jgi:hypothetical protein
MALQHTGTSQMATLGFVEALWLYFAKAKLHGFVPVTFANPDLCDYTWSDFDYRYWYDCASLVEYLGHADFATHQTFDHNPTSAALR